MIEFETSIRIERSVSEVFSFVADLENLPKWNYFVTQVRKTSEGPVGVGTTYHQIRKTDRQDLRIVEFDQDRAISIETIPPSKPDLEREMVFRAENGSTRIIDRWKLDTGRPGFLQKLARGRVRSAVEENLGKLKELLETGRATLQDGRRVSL